VNGKHSMKRILALRRLEEEREEAVVLRQQLLRDASLRALTVIEQEKVLASRALHQALLAGERRDALSAEMVLACWPIRQHALEQDLAKRESELERVTQSCAEARLRRRQTETAFAWITQAEDRTNALREQKALDDWSQRSRRMLQPWSAIEDESSQRRNCTSPPSDGTDLAEVDIG
jgi:hypothetical protein